MPLPQAIDLLPALLLPAFLLLALAVSMPFTGGRAERRREAWARFDALIRIRGISTSDREVLAAWAQIAYPDHPHYVLVRRRDFDRFARGEVQRLRGCDEETFRRHLDRLARLRRSLGFDRSPGLAQSSHDIGGGEQVLLRPDEDATIRLRVRSVDEEGIWVEPIGPGARLVAGWATFARDGEGQYRFRTRPVREGKLAHGNFLIHEDRRQEPRVPLPSAPFWIAVDQLPDGAAPEDPEGVEVLPLDVSLGGLALLADREVRKGSELWIDLPLGQGADGPVLRGLRARVLANGFREGGGSRPHFLSCSFTSLEEPKRKVLETYVWSHLERNLPS